MIDGRRPGLRRQDILPADTGRHPENRRANVHPRKKSGRHFSPAMPGNSVSESLAALCTSSFENISAIGGLHSLAEAMLLLSLALFRLISSEHSTIPPCSMIGSGQPKAVFRFLYNDGLYYIQFRRICQGFSEKNSSFRGFFPTDRTSAAPCPNTAEICR